MVECLCGRGVPGQRLGPVLEECFECCADLTEICDELAVKVNKAQGALKVCDESGLWLVVVGLHFPLAHLNALLVNDVPKEVDGILVQLTIFQF